MERRCVRCNGVMDEFAKEGKVEYLLCLECSVEDEMSKEAEPPMHS